MIHVTRLNGSSFYVNAELIKFVESTPDTVISLVDGTKLVVRESSSAVVQSVVAYRQLIHQAPSGQPGQAG